MDSTKIRTLRRGDGAYAIAASSGLLTTVAAATDSAGHIFACRWAPAAAGTGPQYMVLQRIRAKLVSQFPGFTAAQELGIDLAILQAYTAAHTAGTAITPTKKRATFAASAFQAASIQIGTTGALTDGTHSAITNIIGADSAAEPAAAVTTKSRLEIFKSTEDLDREPIVLAPNQGLVVRTPILMGAAGTARLIVEMDWLEVGRY